MAEPILKTQEVDTTKYNDLLSKFNQRNLQNTTEQSSQPIVAQKENLLKKNEANTTKKEDVLKEEAQTNEVGFDNMGKRLSEMTGITQVFFQFELSEDRKDLIMKVLDADTQEVLQQYPSDVSLKIAQMIEEHLGRGQIANATV